MENAWMPKVAGILDIVAGALGIFGGFFLVLWLAFVPYMTSGPGTELHYFPMRIMMLFMLPWAFIMFAGGVLAVVGGIYALKSKRWGLALAGSIGAVFSQLALGVVALIFTVMGKDHFE
jgi:hypothetical protein